MIKLPSWAPTLYPYQVDAIQQIIEAFDRGAQVVMLDAPTGSGKTLIAEMVRQNLNARALYLCNSLALQTQFCNDFPHAALIMGRSNYPTADYPSQYPKLTAGDCTKERLQLPGCTDCPDSFTGYESLHCAWCHPVSNCPYEEAKAAALGAPLVCSNTSYFLYEAHYVGVLPQGRQLIVIDEADVLEDVLLNFIEVTVSQRKADEYGIGSPYRKTVEASWIDWANDAEQTLASIPVSGRTVKAIRHRLSVARLREDIKRLNDVKSGLSAGGWIYTGYNRGDVSFKPIQVSDLAQDYLWQHGKRFLLMSATTISFDVMAKTLGIDL